jgi:hypothetical protein
MLLSITIMAMSLLGRLSFKVALRLTSSIALAATAL